MSIYIGDKEIKNLYAGGSISISDMQGPAPKGFHVPLQTEWQAIYDTLRNILSDSMTGEDFATVLKIPMAGARDNYTTVYDDLGLYWSSSPDEDDYGMARLLSFDTSDIEPQNEDLRAFGLALRCVKNSPTIPTASWEVIYQGSGSAGIFHNPTDGLISLSSDGITWYTLMDKNLGATTVYNYGDTLTDANCGNVFQRGNNYAFPGTLSSDSITTSDSQVDVTGYGPGNYYESSTWITENPRQTLDNDGNNLRGGVSQGTTEKPKEAKAVYLGENKVRPAYKPRTFTISWTEQSNMSSGWTYSDDAAGLSAGSGDFDDFFGYYGCRLNTSGVETAKITQEESGGAGKLDITQLGTLTSGDNVMIAFPVRGIKMSKSGSTVTLSITEELGKDGYQYYAHSTGTLASPGTPKDAFYLGAYKGYNSSNVLKSWSGKTPYGGGSPANFSTFAKANGNGYNTIGFYQRMYIDALYMMKYGNPNSQSVVGAGYTGGSSAISTGGTNSQTNATYGTTSTTTQIKLFGLEDRWGNLRELLGGTYTDSSKQLYTTLSGWTGLLSGGEGTGTTITHTGSYYNLSSIAGNNKAMFMPLGTVNNTSYNTYYCDAAYVTASTFAVASGNRNTGVSAGALWVQIYIQAGGGNPNVGSRLMYLNGLT